MGPIQKYLNGPQLKRALQNNIDPGGPNPLNLIFSNQIKNAPPIIFK